MNATSEPIGVLVISHGSPRPEANAGFAAMVARVAARLDCPNVLPACFSIAKPDIAEQLAELASRGVRRVLLMPYFLYTGQHVVVDIPEILRRCRCEHPDIALELLPTLESDPALEDVVVERLEALMAPAATLPVEGPAIERRSYTIIDRHLGEAWRSDPAARRIAARIVHATADPAMARSLRIHPEAVARGRAALLAGKPVVCDVRMLQAGLTKIPREVICAIDQPGVAETAARCGSTRAAAAFELLAPQWDGGIVAVGNAPTALWKVLELARRGGPRPALVVGLPVGFVGARESKLALLESDLCYVTNTSVRGGSPVAAAALNAIATLAEEKLS